MVICCTYPLLRCKIICCVCKGYYYGWNNNAFTKSATTNNNNNELVRTAAGRPRNWWSVATNFYRQQLPYVVFRMQYESKAPAGVQYYLGGGGGGRPKSTDITCDMAFILLVHVVVLQDKKVLDVATHMKIILPVFGFV